MKANEIQQFFNKFKDIPLLTKEEEQALLMVIHDAPRGENLKILLDDPIVEHAYHALITKNMRLVLSRCLKFCSDIKDPRLPGLVSAGTQGLIRALEKFDATTGHRLSTYSTCWIEANIYDELKRITPNNKLYRSLDNQYVKAYRTIRRETNTTPTQKEVFAFLDWDEAKQIKYLTDKDRIQINIADLTTDGTHWIDPNLIVEDTTDADFAVKEQNNIVNMIREHVQMLQPVEREVISALYGINRPKRNLKDLEKRLGLARKTINQVRDNALRTLYMRIEVAKKGPSLDEGPSN